MKPSAVIMSLTGWESGWKETLDDEEEKGATVMTNKIKMLLAAILACVFVLLVSVASCAEDLPEEFIEEDLVEIDDDWGYVSPEVIEQHTPEMTPEFIHADDPDWVPEEQEEEQPEETEEEKPEEVIEDLPTEIAEDEPEEPEETVEPVEQVETANDDPVEDQPAEQDDEPAEEPKEDDNREAAADQSGEDTDVTDEPETEGQPEEAEEQEPETETGKVTVTVLTSMSNETEMKLEAVVNDPLNRDFLYQWQVSEDGGANYRDMENETNADLSVELTEDNIHNLWRVKVQFL